MTPQGRAYQHPRPDPAHVMRVYRAYVLGIKRKRGSARGLIRYRELVLEYLAAKRALTIAAARQ